MFYREHLNEECAEPCNRFGVKPSSASNKVKQIRDWFDMMPLNPDWCLPSRIDQNPFAWMIEVDGLLVDARRAPRAIQEETFRLGLIPYVPADR